MEGRKSSASSFAARLGLRPLSAINPEDARRGSHAQTYSPGSSRASSPASSRRSSHAEPVSMSSLPSKSIGQYPQRNEAAPLKYRRPSSVAGDLAQTSAKKEKESPVAPGIHARKASTVERNPNLVRRGSSAYGSGLTGGRLSMTTPLARDDIDDAQGHEDREERLRNNTSALVLAAKNLLGSDVTNQDAAGDTELARLLKMLFWDAAKVQQEIAGQCTCPMNWIDANRSADIPIHGSSIDKAQTIMALKEFGTQLLNLLSQVASNSTFQSMYVPRSTLIVSIRLTLVPNVQVVCHHCRIQPLVVLSGAPVHAASTPRGHALSPPDHCPSRSSLPTCVPPSARLLLQALVFLQRAPRKLLHFGL